MENQVKSLISSSGSDQIVLDHPVYLTDEVEDEEPIIANVVALYQGSVYIYDNHDIDENGVVTLVWKYGDLDDEIQEDVLNELKDTLS